MPRTNRGQTAKKRSHLVITFLLRYILIKYIFQLHRSAPTALIHISCVLKRSETRKNAPGLLRISSLYIPCLLRWSEKNFRVYGLLCTASLQISYVLNQSGTNAKERGSMRTASLRISWVLGITIIRRRIISEGFILFCFFSWVRVKFYGQSADQPLN